jgi:hypothetical protein
VIAAVPLYTYVYTSALFLCAMQVGASGYRKLLNQVPVGVCCAHHVPRCIPSATVTSLIEGEGTAFVNLAEAPLIFGRRAKLDIRQRICGPAGVQAKVPCAVYPKLYVDGDPAGKIKTQGGGTVLSMDQFLGMHIWGLVSCVLLFRLFFSFFFFFFEF